MRGQSTASLSGTAKRFFLIISIILFLVCQGGPLHASEKTVVGVIFSADIPYYRAIHQAFSRVIKERGYAGKIQLIIQRPNPDTLAWSNAIRKVLAYDASIIITYGSGAAFQATYETTSVPIVYAGVYAPDKIDLKKKNVYGVGFRVPVSSLLRYLRQMKEIKRLGIVFSEIEPDSVQQMKDVVNSCRRFSLPYVQLSVKRCREVKERLKLYNYDSLFLTNSALVGKYYPDCKGISDTNTVPAVTTMKGYEDLVIVTLTPDTEIEGALLADILIDLLRGKKPENKIVTNNKLVFNMKKAKKLGISFPIELITGADRVIK